MSSRHVAIAPSGRHQAPSAPRDRRSGKACRSSTGTASPQRGEAAARGEARGRASGRQARRRQPSGTGSNTEQCQGSPAAPVTCPARHPAVRPCRCSPRPTTEPAPRRRPWSRPRARGRRRELRGPLEAGRCGSIHSEGCWGPSRFSSITSSPRSVTPGCAASACSQSAATAGATVAPRQRSRKPAGATVAPRQSREGWRQGKSSSSPSRNSPALRQDGQALRRAYRGVRSVRYAHCPTCWRPSVWFAVLRGRGRASGEQGRGPGK